ncbi:MAG: hypothetical protein ACRD30_05155, partial [Bryobacteraceae bacterium]
MENLTGDASLDWVPQAAPAIATAEMSGASKIFALPAATVSDAYLAGANRLVHGYFVRKNGALWFEFEDEDASTHRMTRHFAESGGVLTAMNAAAKAIDPSAHAFSSAREEAVEAWGRGEFERATQIDPDFGTAWVAWTES